MRGFLKKFEDLMASVAFAEEGEHEIAREIQNEGKILASKIRTFKNEVDVTIDDLMSIAITFAEAGEHEKAVEFLSEAENRLRRVKDDLHKKLATFSMSSA